MHAVENDAKITHALVGYNAKIGEKAIIHAGSVVGTDVIIGKTLNSPRVLELAACPKRYARRTHSDSESDASSTLSGEDSGGSYLKRDDHRSDFEHVHGEEMAKKFAEQLQLGPDESYNAQSVGVGW